MAARAAMFEQQLSMADAEVLLTGVSPAHILSTV
jgi:hypothetical protein